MAVPARNQRRLVLLLAALSLACAPAPREGETVHIAEESAIIIWDAASKTQHFIRRASFETKAKDFGFLVPTPTAPELSEADDEAFRMLEDLAQPPARALAAAAPPKDAAKPVEVIAKVKVAGYDAAVLSASDADALDKWLKGNQYHSSPELVAWYRPYVEKKWIITAFKLSREQEPGSRVNASAVRMSFKAEQAFFPYREPAAAQGAAGGPRLLRIYFLSESIPEGKLGADGAWQVRPAWSGAMGDEQRAGLMKLLKLPEAAAGAARHLTLFNDTSAPRPGKDDLFFAPAADQSQASAQPDAAQKKRAADRAAKHRSNLILLVIFIAIGLVGAFVTWRVTRRK